jgi:hypothetical protein
MTAMRKRQVTISALALGLLCASAWYVVFGLGLLFHLDYPSHILWGHVTIAAALSFVVGWGIANLIGSWQDGC